MSQRGYELRKEKEGGGDMSGLSFLLSVDVTKPFSASLYRDLTAQDLTTSVLDR